MASKKRDDKVVQVPVRFLRDLTTMLVQHVVGRGSPGRKNEIADAAASLLRRYSLEGPALLSIAQTVGEALADDLAGSKAGKARSARRDIGYDGESGALCWSPEKAASTIGVSTRQLAEWRARGEGPPFLKLSKVHAQGRVAYPVISTREWLAEQLRLTAERYSTEDAA